MLSLSKNIRTAKVDAGWASRIESDRFENPNIMVCPRFSGVDNAGRPVCPDSYVTKTAGCNSPMDRVTVENHLRPQYIEYVNLNAKGISAPFYGSLNMHRSGQNVQLMENYESRQVAGSYGGQVQSVQSTAPLYAYQEAMAQNAVAARKNIALNNGFKSNSLRRSSGN